MTKETKVIEPSARKQGAHNPIDPKAVRTNIGVPDEDSLAPQTYLVTERSFINGQLVEAGDHVRLPDDVQPGKRLKPVGTARGGVTQKALNEARARSVIADQPKLPTSASGQMERQFQQGGNKLNELEQADAFQEGREAENALADKKAEEFAEQQKNAVKQGAKEPEGAGQKTRAANAAGRRLTADNEGKHESKDSDPI